MASGGEPPRRNINFLPGRIYSGKRQVSNTGGRRGGVGKRTTDLQRYRWCINPP